MPSPRWLTVSLALLALCVGGASVPPRDETPGAAQLRLGMAPAEVRQHLGPPHRVARQILYHRYLEQWIYNPPLALRVEFDCPQGQTARLTSVGDVGSDKLP